VANLASLSRRDSLLPPFPFSLFLSSSSKIMERLGGAPIEFEGVGGLSPRPEPPKFATGYGSVFATYQADRGL